MWKKECLVLSYVQGSKKVPSASLGELDFHAGQVTLAYLSSKQG